MKKTLIISNFYPPQFGGIQNYIYNLATRLPQDKTFVLADKKPNSLRFDNGQKHSIYRKSFRSPLRHFKLTSLDLLLKTYRIIKRHKIERLIAGHFYLPALTCYLLNKMTGIPYQIFTYGTEITELRHSSNTKKQYMHKIFAQAEKVYTISDYLKNILIKNKVDPQKIVKIYPGVDHNIFKPLASIKARQYIAKKISFDLTGYNIILSLGRLVKRKGHDSMIKALPEILKKYPKTKYLIVGDGPDREYLKNITREVNMEKYVIFAGAPKNEDILYYYNACDVFTMPSRTLKKSQDVEGFGIVYLEASACAKPVVAGAGGGVSEAVEYNKSGIIVDSKKPSLIALAILSLLDNSYKMASMGEYGRKRVIKHFNWDNLAKILQNNL